MPLCVKCVGALHPRLAHLLVSATCLTKPSSGKRGYCLFKRIGFFTFKPISVGFILGDFDLR